MWKVLEMSEWASHLSLEYERAMSIAMTFAATQGDKKFVRGRLPDRDANIDALS